MAAQSKPPTRAATYADLEALPPNVVGELIAGVLRATPRPGGSHTLAASELGAELSSPFSRGRGGPGGWWILDEPELHLGGDVLVPDLAGWRRERLPDVRARVHFDVASDWVCEVLSPSTAAFDRSEKLPLYARAGVQHAWLIDPTLETLEALRLDHGRGLLLGAHCGNVRVRAEPFEAIELALGPLCGAVVE
ncbi:MAG: hypothetical protein NVS3B10_13480 [Polyangiales bacterium]